nr:DBP [Bearded dragon adenovirus 1]
MSLSKLSSAAGPSARAVFETGEMDQDDVELTQRKIQKALECLNKIGRHLAIPTDGFTFHPESNECEKLFLGFFRKNKPTLNYSTPSSVGAVGGRMLWAAVCRHVGLEPNFNATGCSLWRHQWKGLNIKCFHGVEMPFTENSLEMNPTSEAAINAMKEGKGTMAHNRWGRAVVRVPRPDFCQCFADLNSKFNMSAPDSCGLCFSSGEKAAMAMKNAEATVKAVFPKSKSEGKILIPVYCFCNAAGKKLQGRQLPRITPFALSGADNLSVRDLSAAQAASVKHPAVFVFQCCNHAGFRSKSGCDFKISFTDLMVTLCLVRNLWQGVFKSEMPIVFGTFRWNAALRNCSFPLPPSIVCEDASPFGDGSDSEEEKEKPGPSKKATKRPRVVIEEEQEEEEEEEEGPSSTPPPPPLPLKLKRKPAGEVAKTAKGKKKPSPAKPKPQVVLSEDSE